ncbi:hypothetical protein NDU88_003817 [Pleurodeles waltl]|uniref:Ig-like domain-containing protein n=1 Tax=Pleurodeles waltl TaxID=8319 RepID=A0AAV7VGE2_PLEWA|nr:hypothetical protein NDU88_003817 [Pleurodeles waltl]
MITCQNLTLVQSPISITRPMGKTAKLLCVVDGESVVNRGVHWYHQKGMQLMVWVLFYKPGQQEVSDGYKTRVSLEANGDKSCTLSITNIKESDDSVYFCASWHITQ